MKVISSTTIDLDIFLCNIYDIGCPKLRAPQNMLKTEIPNTNGTEKAKDALLSNRWTLVFLIGNQRAGNM